MDVSNPMSCVVPSAHGPVLAVLAGTTTPLTGRRVAELAQPRVSQPRVARILRELTAAGLVERTPAGSSSLFVLNREHLAAGAVEILATLRQQLWGADRRARSHLEPPSPRRRRLRFRSAW